MGKVIKKILCRTKLALCTIKKCTQKLRNRNSFCEFVL